MREIKFRALSLYPQTWVYGLYFKSGSEGQWTEIQMENGASVYVDEETISQYTGLKDKNGKEIYEGDVIRSVFGTTNNVVFYSDAGFYQIRNCRTKGTSTLGGNNEGSVVVGNIYENPELLEVK